MQNKILCLGANTEDTDQQATIVAEERGLKNHGLIIDADFQPTGDGIYHTSCADLGSGDIIALARKFDLIKMLDQPRSIWPHWKSLQTTYKIMVELENLGFSVDFRDNENVRSVKSIEDIISNNVSWCIYPWINLISREHTGLHLCARSPSQITKECTGDAWKNSTIRKDIQHRMLQGERMPEHCSKCYEYEDLGIESYRQYESRDWLNQLDISSLDQLSRLDDPIYYEIHWGNKCNLKCRSCVPSRSSAIEIEFKKYDINPPFFDNPITDYPSIDIINISSLTRLSRVYISGGEPVIMPETVEFMRRCIDQRRTDFELTMSTNGVKIPAEFQELSKHFKNLNLSFSIDGYGKINDYWRSGSQWIKIVENMHRMQDLGHSISVNCVPGIYNATNLHLLFEWLDVEFPLISIYLQINYYEAQSVYNHPDVDRVIDSMKRCQNTRVYWSDGKSCKTGIDSILEYYSKSPQCNIESLREFFTFNDRLDEIRGVRLVDHIPELEACRTLIK